MPELSKKKSKLEEIAETGEAMVGGWRHDLGPLIEQIVNGTGLSRLEALVFVAFNTAFEEIQINRALLKKLVDHVEVPPPRDDEWKTPE